MNYKEQTDIIKNHIEEAIDIISNGLDIKDFCYNIYERDQKEKYKAYFFVTLFIWIKFTYNVKSWYL